MPGGDRLRQYCSQDSTWRARTRPRRQESVLAQIHQSKFLKTRSETSATISIAQPFLKYFGNLENYTSRPPNPYTLDSAPNAIEFPFGTGKRHHRGPTADVQRQTELLPQGRGVRAAER